jgi:uncharacterized protein
MRAVACLLLLALCGGVALAADPLPPKPADYVEDTAGILRPATRSALARQLAQFERGTSNQVLVATFPKVPDDYAMEDFTQRTASAWGVGQKERDNGAVLFIFPQDRKMRIEVGYGLEGAIPDVTAKSIIDGIIRPAFRSGDFDGGVSRGVDAILQAARGEYKGTGRTVAESTVSVRVEDSSVGIGIATGFALLLLFAVIIPLIRLSQRAGWDYTGTGTRRRGTFLDSGLGSGGFGGGSWGGGGGSSSGSGGGFSSGSSDSGGFSGGGGDFGGGGASGGW